VDTNNGGYNFMVFNSTPYQEIDFDIKVSGDNGTPATKAYVSQLAADLFGQGVLLPSEYVELQENLPNKDRIVARLREQEQSMQNQQMAAQNAPMSAQTPNDMQIPTEPIQEPETGQKVPDLGMIYESAPPEVQQEIDLMLEQGMDEQSILQQLLALMG
jgi:hypothetical protein